MGKIENNFREEIPSIFFMVLHTSGNVIFTYPSLGKRKHTISSLVGAILALGDEVSEVTNEVGHTILGKREIFLIKEGEITYSLFVSQKAAEKQQIDNLLLMLVNILKSEFPAENDIGIKRASSLSKELENEIESIIERFMSETSYELSKESVETLPLFDISQIMGRDKFTQVFRGLLAEKKVILLGYDPTLLVKLINSLEFFWSEKFKVVLGTDFDTIKDEKNVFIIVFRWMENEVREKVENATYIDLDASFMTQLESDFLLEKLDSILDLEREENKRTMLKNEIITLKTILNDVKKLLSKFEDGIHLEKLREKLGSKHPKEKVNYVLEVLINEGSPIAKKIRTPFSQFF